MSPRTRTQPPTPAVPEGYGYDELLPLARAALAAGLSVLVRGHPGIGKSALAHDLAQRLGLPLLDIRLAQRDPAEIGGVYFPNRATRCIELLAPDWVRQACEQPGFVFLDEINAAVTKLHQAAAYQIVLEHRVGPFAFHPETVVMAAGNLEEDRALVTPLSAALCNRFVHFTLRVDVPCWIQWAVRAGIDPRIMAFIQSFGPDVLYRAGDDYAFPTPRSWEMASRILATARDGDDKRAVAACVGSPMATELFQFIEVYRKVDAERILTRSDPIDFTRGRHSEPSFVFAAVFAVGAYAVRTSLTPAHVENMVRFLRSPGLDPEYQMLFLRHIRPHAANFEKLKALADFRALAGELVGLKQGLYDR